MAILVIVIVLLFFRLVNLNLIPVFADEAIYIHWAQIAWHDHTQRFIALTDGKPPLHTWLMIPFLKTFTDPLIAGRLLSVAAGLLTLTGLYLLTKKLFNKNMALISGFLVAISPFLVFYDRLAVADSLLTAFGVWSFYLGLLLLEKPDLGKAFLLGFCWGGGLLTKQPGWYFIVLLPLHFFLIESKKTKKLDFKKWFLEVFKTRLPYLLLAFIIAYLVYNVVKLSPFSHLLSVRSYDYVLGKREFLKEPFQLFWGNLKAIISWINSYQQFLGIALFLIGLLYMFKKEFRKAIVLLSWVTLPIIGSAFIGKIIFPRYFVIIEPWVIIFIAYGLNTLIKQLILKFKLKNKSSFIISYSLFIILSLPWLFFSFKLVFNPVKAPLIRREQDQYLTTWAAGYGIKEVADYLKENYPHKRVDVGTEGYFGTLPDGLQIYLDGFSNINVFGVGQPLDKVPEELLERAKLNPTFLVINDSRYYGWGENLNLIAEYPKPEFSFLKESLLFYKVKSE